MLAVYAEYGYSYADGIDGKEYEYYFDFTNNIDISDTEDYVKDSLKFFGDVDELYDELDVKIVFEFHNELDDGRRYGLFLFQRDGELVVYEAPSGDYGNFSVNAYNKDNLPMRNAA